MEMNKTGLFTLTSGLHSEVMPDASEERFIREIAAAGADFDFCGEDFSRYGSHMYVPEVRRMPSRRYSHG